MIFSELYSAYYNTVAAILNVAVDHPLCKGELRKFVEQNAFGESLLNIEPALEKERWQIIRADGTTPIRHPPSMPKTTLQKRWLKAISLDPRIRLFTDEIAGLDDIEPLFRQEDICVFDKYADGDPYEDEAYIRNFRLILDAIKCRYPLSIDTENRKGNITHIVIMPDYLEYSEKDDKFRLVGTGCSYDAVINLGRILKCKPYNKPFEVRPAKKTLSNLRKVEFELINQRNALERVMLHFAHFKKQAEKLDENRYHVTITYDRDDETEIVIRILSFGPMIKVTAPNHFVDLIKERLISQKSCEQ